jgi:hypothetical protein
MRLGCQVRERLLRLNVMTQVVFDRGTLAKLGDLQQPLEICDERGQIVGFFHPALPSDVLKRMASESPFSEAELQAMWQEDRAGRPLRDVMRETIC